MDATRCELCGAAVLDPATHELFHAQLARLALTVEAGPPEDLEDLCAACRRIPGVSAGPR